MSTDELRNYATVATAVLALTVFIANSLANLRNRRLENLTRFIEAHDRLFARGGFLAKHVVSVEAGTFVRDPADSETETKIHLMLLDLEQLALLANNDAVPRMTQVYMLGAYAKHLLEMLTPAERQSMMWELAVGYLNRLASDTERYKKLTRSERAQYWR